MVFNDDTFLHQFYYDLDIEKTIMDDDDGGGDVGLKVGEVFRRPSSLFNNLFMSFLKHSLAFTHNGDDQHDEDGANIIK